MRFIVFRIFAILFSVILTSSFLEIVFRMLPVSTSSERGISGDNPILRFQPNSEVTWSRGWRFQLVKKKKANNYGFLTDINYHRSHTKPRMAIIGDSYVEARQINSEKTIHGILQKKIRGKGTVYGFGYSGLPLSGYLAYANYIRQEFSPDSMVFVVVANDFDQSLCKYNRRHEGMHCFKENHRGYLELVLSDFRPSPLRRFARKSAFLRYIFLTLGFNWHLFADRMSVRTKTDPTYVGNVKFQVSKKRMDDSKRAVREFFHLLPKKTGLPANRILLVMDGIRPELYRPEKLDQARRGYSGKMRRFFIKMSVANGYQIVDLQPIFVSEHKKHGTTFEFLPIDAHWNESGHAIVAAAIMKTSVFKRTFK